MTEIAKPATIPAKFRILKAGSGLTRRLPFAGEDFPTHGVTFAKWLTGHAVIDPAGKWLAVTPDADGETVDYLTAVAFGKRKTETVHLSDETGTDVGAYVTVTTTTKKGA